MWHGTVNLGPLYTFATAWPDIPHRTKDTSCYRQYREMVLGLVRDVPDQAGWYCWHGLGKAIYVGRSSRGTTSALSTRLRDELLEDCVPFWLPVDTKAGQRLTEKYDGRYRDNHARAELRAGSEWITWVCCPAGAEAELAAVEAHLIADLHPTANINRPARLLVTLLDPAEVAAVMLNALKTHGA